MPRSTTPKLESANIPAFQRKRSLAAKARRKAEPRTALERREAGISVVKPKRTRRTVRSSSVGTLFGAGSSSGLTSSGLTSSGSSLSDPDYRAKIAARRAALSSGSGFSAPVVDEYDTPSYDSPTSSYGVSESFREMRACGTITGFFEQIDVAVVDVHSRISVGDKLIFETIDGLFEQTLDSMQVDRKDVEVAYSGDDVGIKVKSKPRKGGQVYKVV